MHACMQHHHKPFAARQIVYNMYVMCSEASNGSSYSEVKVAIYPYCTLYHNLTFVTSCLYVCTCTYMYLIPAGNVIEWRYPDVVNLDGVEFKSMASGLHNVPKDFM